MQESVRKCARRRIIKDELLIAEFSFIEVIKNALGAAIKLIICSAMTKTYLHKLCTPSELACIIFEPQKDINLWLVVDLLQVFGDVYVFCK